MGLTTNLDVATLFQRVLAYLAEGTVVALAAYFIPGRLMKADEIACIALIATATFGLLDMFMGPGAAISRSVRVGAGWGIGANLVGFPGALFL